MTFAIVEGPAGASASDSDSDSDSDCDSDSDSESDSASESESASPKNICPRAFGPPVWPGDKDQHDRSCSERAAQEHASPFQPDRSSATPT